VNNLSPVELVREASRLPRRYPLAFSRALEKRGKIDALMPRDFWGNLARKALLDLCDRDLAILVYLRDEFEGRHIERWDGVIAAFHEHRRQVAETLKAGWS
jgi:hypothetical protein